MTLRNDHAVGPQVSQMFGDGYLGQFQNVLEMANAERSLCEQMQNAKASFIAKAAVNLHQLHMQG
jgi:hypothetical protein